MNHQLTEKQAIFRFAKVFVGQYLSSIHGYDSFQNEAINLLAHHLLQFIKSLAYKVKQLLNLQGRTIPNSLHLLVVTTQNGLFTNVQQLLGFIIKRKNGGFDTKSLQVIEKLGKKLFENDIESINNYEKQKINPNVRYIPTVYITDINKKALPYRHPVDEAFQMPPEITYQETKEKVSRDKKNIQLLSAYTKRENKIAMMGRMLDEEKEKGKKKEKRNEDEEDRSHLPQKRKKFDNIDYL